MLALALQFGDVVLAVLDEVLVQFFLLVDFGVSVLGFFLFFLLTQAQLAFGGVDLLVGAQVVVVFGFRRLKQDVTLILRLQNGADPPRFARACHRSCQAAFFLDGSNLFVHHNIWNKLQRLGRVSMRDRDAGCGLVHPLRFSHVLDGPPLRLKSSPCHKSFDRCLGRGGLLL